MGGEELKWHQLAHNQLISLQGPHFSPHSTAKTNDKSTNLRRIVSSGTSVVAFASVYSEKTRLKKLMIMITITGVAGAFKKMVRPGSGCGHPVMCAASC